MLAYLEEMKSASEKRRDRYINSDSAKQHSKLLPITQKILEKYCEQNNETLMHWDSLFVLPLTILKGDKIPQRGEPKFVNLTGKDGVKRACLKPYFSLVRIGYTPNCIALPSDSYLLIIMRSCINV